jgi:hypothetical protein
VNPEKVEIRWYVAAHPADAGHVTVVGDTKWSRMYWDFAQGQWERDPAYATSFFSRKEAETAALTLAATHPQYLSKLRIKRWRFAWHPAPPPLNA